MNIERLIPSQNKKYVKYSIAREKVQQQTVSEKYAFCRKMAHIPDIIYCNMYYCNTDYICH